MAAMKVKDLIKKLQAMDENAIVVTSGYDHSYDSVRIVCEKTAFDCQGDLYEDWGDDNKLKETDQRVAICLID